MPECGIADRGEGVWLEKYPSFPSRHKHTLTSLNGFEMDTSILDYDDVARVQFLM